MTLRGEEEFWEQQKRSSSLSTLRVEPMQDNKRSWGWRVFWGLTACVVGMAVWLNF